MFKEYAFFVIATADFFDVEILIDFLACAFVTAFLNVTFAFNVLVFPTLTVYAALVVPAFATLVAFCADAAIAVRLPTGAKLKKVVADRAIASGFARILLFIKFFLLKFNNFTHLSV